MSNDTKRTARRRPMETTTHERATRPFDVATGLNSDTAALYAGVNQRVIGDLAELSIGTLKENARLLAELQMAVLETLRETQAAGLRLQSIWPDALTDPLGWYQKAVVEGVDCAQRVLVCAGTNARALAQSVDRLQVAAAETGRRVRETLASTVGGLRETGHRVA
jgi:hypothetical protein